MVTSPPLLLVDSDPGERHALTTLLEPAGFAITVVSTLEAALERLDQKPPVALIVLGPTVPGGGDIIGPLRAKKGASTPPVIAVVPGGDEGSDERVGGLFASGADDVVRRSAGPAEVAARLRARARSSARGGAVPSGGHPYVHLLENAADGIAVIDYEGRLQFANARALDLFGASKEFPLDAPRARHFLSSEDAPLADQLKEGFRAGVFPQGVDLRVRHVDGTSLTVCANFSVLRAERVVVVTFRDVTAERETSRELRKTKGFLESVIENSADGIVSADPGGVVRLFNRAAERCTGFRADEVVGSRRLDELLAPGVAGQVDQMMQRRGGRLDAFRTELVGRQGERVPVLLSLSLIVEAGVMTGTVAVFSDMRERLRMESRLVAAHEELKLRERQAIVAELAGAAAHELNQPLTSVMGYAEMMKRKLGVDSPVYAAADIILGEATRMADIIRKLGTVARYETKSYVGQAKILDLDLSSGGSNPPPPDTQPQPTLAPPSAPTMPSSIPPSSAPAGGHDAPPSTPENPS